MCPRVHSLDAKVLNLSLRTVVLFRADGTAADEGPGPKGFEGSWPVLGVDVGPSPTTTGAYHTTPYHTRHVPMQKASFNLVFELNPRQW